MAMESHHSSIDHRPVLAADLIAFQTYDCARYFISACESLLGVESSPRGLEYKGHFSKICICPVGIDPDRYYRLAERDEGRQVVGGWENKYENRSIVLSVDSLESTRGLVHKFMALEELFLNHSELTEKVVFVQVALPGASTDGAMDAQISSMTTRINSKLSRGLCAI